MKHKVVKATFTKDGWIVELDCGHIKEIAPHFNVKIGEYLTCYKCEKDQRS